MKSQWKAGWWLLGAVMLASASHANIYTLDQQGCTVSCGPAPYGTVEVTQPAVGSLLFSVELNAPYAFHSTNAAPHPAFAFSLAGNPQITIGALTNPFVAEGTQSAGTNGVAGYGNFDYVITFPQASNPPQPNLLSFTATSGGLTLASLETSSTGYWFAADIINTSTLTPPDGFGGNTGNVAAIPEPGSYALLLAGLGVIAFIARRRQTRD